jgi:hypothetical protein
MTMTYKTTLRRVALALAVAGGVACYPVGYYAYAPPPAPLAEAAVAAPGPGYVWMGGYYSWGAAGYFWVPGRWALPPQGYHVWVAGGWYAHGRRWVWPPGRWR